MLATRSQRALIFAPAAVVAAGILVRVASGPRSTDPDSPQTSGAAVDLAEVEARLFRTPPFVPAPAAAPAPLDAAGLARAVERLRGAPDAAARLDACRDLAAAGAPGLDALAACLRSAADADPREAPVVLAAAQALARARDAGWTGRAESVLDASVEPLVHRTLLLALLAQADPAADALAVRRARADLDVPALRPAAHEALAHALARGLAPPDVTLSAIGFDDADPADARHDVARVDALNRLARALPLRLAEPVRAALLGILDAPYRPFVKAAAAEALVLAGDAARVRERLPVLEREAPGLGARLRGIGLP